MDWERYVQLGVLIAIGFLVFSRSRNRFNSKYLVISIMVIALLWGIFTYIGYGY